MELIPENLLAGLMKDAGGVAVFCVALLLLFGLAEFLYRVVKADVEHTRKTVHLGSGCLVLTIPYVFHYTTTALLLAVTFFGLMGLSKKLGLLPSVHGVERKSSGAFIYPLSIVMVLLLSGGHTIVFQISILVLASSDALAAVVGKSYGRIHYRILNQTRSVEGSIVFLLNTFLVVHIPLLLSSQVGRLESLLIALLIAVLVTAFEAISVGGWDNLVIPLVVLLALERTLPMDAAALWPRVVFMVVLLAMVLASFRARRLTLAAGFATFLMAYMAVALGGWAWLAPLLVYYATFNLGVPLTSLPQPQVTHLDQGGDVDANDLQRIYTLFLVPMLALVLFGRLQFPQLLYVFATSMAVLFAVSWATFADIRARMQQDGICPPPRVATSPAFIAGGAAGMMMLYASCGWAPGSVLVGNLGALWLSAACATAGVLMFVMISNRWRARFACPQCGLVSVNAWCHGVEGTLRAGSRALNFERCVLAGELLAAALWLAATWVAPLVL